MLTLHVFQEGFFPPSEPKDTQDGKSHKNIQQYLTHSSPLLLFYKAKWTRSDMEIPDPSYSTRSILMERA